MKQNQVRSIVVHSAAPGDGATQDKVDQFYVDIIERTLNRALLTPTQRVAVMDAILANRKQSHTKKI